MWFFSPDHQLYATVSEGYRRGGTNGTPTTGNFAEDPAWTTYKSDTVRNHELGIKGRVGRMSYNADVFYVDWKDPQVNSSPTWWGFFAEFGRASCREKVCQTVSISVVDV